MTSFEALRNDCLSQGKLYEDADFPAIPSSIYPGETNAEYYPWKRPKDICADPKFIVEGVSRFDLYQGELGDCWYVVSAAVLATKKDLFAQVVPSDQGFEDGQYAGIFHFSFWRFGKWTEVIIDDRLPVDLDGNLRYCSNKSEPNEFWGALLEKAYTKLQGSYIAMDSGFPRDALVDFTGGISETYNFSKEEKLPENMYEIMLTSFDAGSLLGAGIRGDKGATSEGELSNGLHTKHAYSVTYLLETQIQGQTVRLVRLRNPWGQGEWNGAWSDGSAEWNSLSDEDRKKIGLVFDTDGEFWMSFEDMKENFDILDIVHLSPEMFSKMEVHEDNVVWKETQYHGQWVKGVNAGGSGFFGKKEQYYLNPQYFMRIVTPDDGDVAGQCTCIVSLMQKDWRRRKLDPKFKRKSLDIGFGVHLVKGGEVTQLNADTVVDKDHLESQYKAKRTYLREISVRLNLEPGLYCIIPNAFKVDQEGSFVLRIFTYANVDTITIDDKNEPIPAKGGEDGTDEVDYPQGTIPNDAFLECAGEDEELDARDLRDLLTKFSKTQLQESFAFGVESCRTLIAMSDDDLRCGTLDYDQMSRLWNEILMWRNLFTEFDKDKSGSVNTYELKNVFKSLGFSLSFDTISTIAVRYGGKERTLFFEDFAVCLAKTVTMFVVFKKYREDTSGEARLNIDEWLKTTLFY